MIWLQVAGIYISLKPLEALGYDLGLFRRKKVSRESKWNMNILLLARIHLLCPMAAPVLSNPSSALCQSAFPLLTYNFSSWVMDVSHIPSQRSLILSFLKTYLFVKLLIGFNNSDLCSVSVLDIWEVVSFPLLHFYPLLESSFLCPLASTLPHSLKNVTLLLIPLLAFHLMIPLHILDILLTQDSQGSISNN